MPTTDRCSPSWLKFFHCAEWQPPLKRLCLIWRWCRQRENKTRCIVWSFPPWCLSLNASLCVFFPSLPPSLFLPGNPFCRSCSYSAGWPSWLCSRLSCSKDGADPLPPPPPPPWTRLSKHQCSSALTPHTHSLPHPSAPFPSWTLTFSEVDSKWLAKELHFNSGRLIWTVEDL